MLAIILILVVLYVASPLIMGVIGFLLSPAFLLTAFIVFVAAWLLGKLA